MILDYVADTHDKISEPGQLHVHAGEDFLEFRDDENHEEDQDTDGHDHDGGGIEHGGLDLAFDLLRFFGKFGEALQDDFQHAAELTGFDHVDKKTVENFWMLGQRLGKGAAAFD